METLVVVSRHRNRHYDRNCGYGPIRVNSFKSMPSDHFTGISCRSFHTGLGLLPTPLKSSSLLHGFSAKHGFSASSSPKTPSPPCFNRNQNVSKRYIKRSPVPIPIKFDCGNKEDEGFSFSERWAGPTYSNSPPPSSLPLPKFSLPPKRTVSLDLPKLGWEINVRPIAKSAPASPTRACRISPEDLFESADMATRTLRRILNLDNE
ncbi:hypothetical protein OROHE_024036 [Orobanche hederae]